MTQLIMAVPLDYEMFATMEALGTRHEIKLSSTSAHMLLPEPPQGPDRVGPLRAPHPESEALVAHLGGWGSSWVSGTEPIAGIATVLIDVDVEAELPAGFEGNQVGGPDLDSLVGEVHLWFDSFITWVWGITSQGVDARHPDPRSTHRRSHNIVHRVVSETVASLPNSTSPPLTVVMSDEGPCSERAADVTVISKSVERAGAALPPTIELLASARTACRRGDTRRAMIDIGTAVEAALKALLPTSPKPRTLGSLVRDGSKRGFVGKSARASLVKPRNNAVHKAIAPSFSRTCEALDLAESVVSRAAPELVASKSLRAFNRPQRHDLLLIKPVPARG